MKSVKPLQKLIDSFQKLPGIGPKTAERLSYYLLHVPQSELDAFANALERVKRDTVLCEICKSVSEKSPCAICSDTNRNQAQILVVEQPLDVVAFEKTGKYFGLYHVLHGSINPLDNIGPDEIFLDDLFKRIRNAPSELEIIIATNPTMEGEATSMYITKEVKKIIEEKNGNAKKIILSRLGVGVPTGAYLEFADENTLSQAFEGRKNI